MMRKLRVEWRERRRRLANGRTRFLRRWDRPIGVLRLILTVATFIAAIALITLFVIYVGYDHTIAEYVLLRRGIRLVQGVFLVNVFISLVFKGGATFQGSPVLNRIINITMLLTLLPWLYPHPANPWIPLLEKVLYSRYFLFTVMLIYAVTDISHTVVSLLTRRTNPSLILSGSFLVFILLGTFLLMLPRCSYEGVSFSDALFLSTSAVCITGLSTVDIATTLTPLGILVLALLIQIGALGVMTFTSFFALFFTGTSSIYNQLLLRDVIYSKSMSALFPTLFYILVFTLTLELAGSAALFASVHGTLGLTTREEVIFVLFHSLSAFCNAGFSTLQGGMANPALLYGAQSFYWITSLLIVAGAIGFPILVNIRDVAVSYLKRLWNYVVRRRDNIRPVHIYSVNTRIVLVMFAVLTALSAILFYVFEADNTMLGLNPWERVTQSVFNAVTPRSAGFSSLNPAAFLSPTLLMVMFMMWVGGGSQSTAGGVKVNTLAAIVLNLRAVVRGRQRVSVFHRDISIWSIRRANAVVTLSLLSYAVYSITMLLLEPGLSVKAVLFETLSALFTVGSSLGITAQLSAGSKIVLVTAMFLGRVGLISLLTGFCSRRHDPKIEYPSDNLIIN